ncbi:lytic transglycosylase domain-containing protein [Magnetococcales bacterium HHB-1]
MNIIIKTIGSHLLLIFCAGILILNGTKEAKAISAKEIRQLIKQTAYQERVNPNLLKAIVAAESNFNPNAVSKKGAVGLMQLMPGTAREMGVRNIRHPKENLRGGARYLRKMLSEFRNIRFAVAAYNAGPQAVKKYNGIPPYPETQTYVKRVLTYYLTGSFKGYKKRNFSPYPNSMYGRKRIYRYRDKNGLLVLTDRKPSHIRQYKRLNLKKHMIKKSRRSSTSTTASSRYTVVPRYRPLYATTN